MKSLRFLNLLLGILFSLLLTATSVHGQTSPVPFIDILSPTSASPGNGDFVLTISGANFATGATVQFDGLTLTPAAITRNSLTVTVPASAVASAHTASITVMNPNTNPSNLIKSNVAFFPITTEKAFLQWTSAFSVLDPPPPFGPNLGPPATAIAVGDFNGDGHQDVVVALPGTGTLQIYLGDGMGNFAAAGSVSTGSVGAGGIYALEVGDFNNDGHLDVAATDDGLSLGIFFGDGAGALSAGPTTTLPYWNPDHCTAPRTPPHLGVADIDGDGFLDLIVPTSVGSQIAVLLGDGQGHFRQSSAVALGTVPTEWLPDAPCGISVGDFNNDGWVDLAYTNGQGFTIVAFNDGTGGFSSSNSFSQAIIFYPPTAGDMNGDGFLDLVGGADSLPQNINFFQNQKNGTFATSVSFTLPVSEGIWDNVLGDLTGGGALDAFTIVLGNTDDTTDVGKALIGNGSGSLFPNPGLSGASLGPLAARLGDFNEDGRLDAVYIGLTAPNVSQNGVAFEYWLQIPGPPIWAVPNWDFGTVILHFGQMSGNQQQLLTETLSNSGPNPLDIANICSKDPGPQSSPCSTSTGSVNFPISTAASTCPLTGGAVGTNAGTIQPGGNCTVAVDFQPTTFGTFSATLSVVDDANGVPGSVQNVTLTGTAIELDANVQPPINADGSSVFNSQRGVVPVKFTLQQNGVAMTSATGCQLPAATISITRTAGGAIGAVDTSVYEMAADTGANFRIDTTNCQYVYNVDVRSLGPGSYTVQIFRDPGQSFGGKDPGPANIGSATFGLN